MSLKRWLLLGIVLLLVAGVAAKWSRIPETKKSQESQDFIFEVEPREIAQGETAILRWSIKGATRVRLEESPDSLGGRELHLLGTFDGGVGTLQVRPTEDTTYVISCEGSTTYTCASLSVRVRVKRR